MSRWPPHTIGLMGPFGYGNLGDAAIQQAMIEHIRQRLPGAQIYGYSLNPADTERRHGIRSFATSRQSWIEHGGRGRGRPWQRIARWLSNHPRPLLRTLGRWATRLPIEFGLLAYAHRSLQGVDLLIISGGGQLDDYWGGGGPWSQPYTLLKWGLLARLRGARFAVVSVGAGPIDARLSRVFIRWALGLAGYRSYRDEYSRRFVREIVDFGSTGAVYRDLAHSLPLGRVAPRADAGGRPVVAFGPIGYFRPECWPEHDPAIYAEYLRKITCYVAWLAQQGCAIVFIPGETHYDQLVIDDLRAALCAQGVDLNKHVLPATIENVDDLLAQLAGADMLVASRFHNILLGLMLGKPAIALSYQAKIDALMADVGMADYCRPIAQFDLAWLQASFTAIMHNRAALAERIEQREAGYRAALEEQYERIFS